MTTTEIKNSVPSSFPHRHEQGEKKETPQHKGRPLAKAERRKTSKSYSNRGRKQGKPNKTKQRNGSKERRLYN